LATKAVELIHDGHAQVLMKGSMPTDELMSAIVSREGGLRMGWRISHAFIMDVPTYHKVVIVTDGAINIRLLTGPISSTYVGVKGDTYDCPSSTA
jgi:phosphate acetyltransferase